MGISTACSIISTCLSSFSDDPSVCLQSPRQRVFEVESDISVMIGNLSFHSLEPEPPLTAGAMGANRLDGLVLIGGGAGGLGT